MELVAPTFAQVPGPLGLTLPLTFLARTPLTILSVPDFSLEFSCSHEPKTNKNPSSPTG